MDARQIKQQATEVSPDSTSIAKAIGRIEGRQLGLIDAVADHAVRISNLEERKADKGTLWKIWSGTTGAFMAAMGWMASHLDVGM